MANNDGMIVFEVTADGKHAIADIKEITRAIQQETKNWDKAADESADHIGNSFSSMLKKLVAGFSAIKIGKALLDIGKDAIEAASNLEEVQNVVDVTFGDGASTIEAWAKNAGTQFGLTETQAKRFTSTLGAMMKSAGLASGEIVDMSTDLAGLAADMASFYNLDFDEAFAKIRSGLSGETEPLKQLGVNMSVANLNAFALKQGLEKTFEQMTQGEQVMLRYQYLMSATADAQGDFARTSDGLANSRRALETNLESISTTLGKLLIPAVSDATTFVKELLGALIPEEKETTVLDEISNIDLKTEAKLAEIKKVKQEADALASALDDIFDTDTQDGTEAAAIVAKLGVNSEETAQYLASLGFGTEEINAKEQEWLDTCKRLVKTIPGLNEIINTETGEVKGGTKAVHDYIAAWEQGQRKLALLQSHEEKKTALEEKFSDLPSYELEAIIARSRERDAKNRLNSLKAFNRNMEFAGAPTKYQSSWFGGLTEAQKEWNDAVDDYNKKVAEREKAEGNYDEQVKAYKEAAAAIEYEEQELQKLPGDIDAAGESTENWLYTIGKTEEEIDKLTSNASVALQELSDYVEGVRTATMKSIDSTVKGFEKIETPMMKARQKVADLTDKIGDLDEKSKDYESELKKINDQINATNAEKISAQTIGANLEQQAQYMEDYLKFLEQARANGVSDEILAQLSDGSAESYDYLEALADASDTEVETINSNYQAVIDKKKQLADELTKQQLTVDDTYKTLQEKAAEAVAALDLEEEAKTNAGKTVAGMANGIASHVSEVQTAVDSILEQLNKLDGWGINIDFGGFGSINFTTSSGSDASGRFGIDYVPHDDYIIRAHEGERLLTAQENQIWNSLLNGGVAGFDLEDLGGVMRDNIRPGGNVYLDGSQVGRVISEVQGRNYRSLQRSGWQG